MATDFITLKGKAKWAKFQRPNQWGKWSVDLYLDEDSIQKFRDMKVKNSLKKDEDGYYATLSRPLERIIRGKSTTLTPPLVVDKDNQTFRLGVGNGSDLSVKMERYSYRNPQTKNTEYACRLASVRIDTLVPYDREEEGDDNPVPTSF